LFAFLLLIIIIIIMMIVDWWSIYSWQPVQRMDILLAWPWQKSPIFWDPWFPRDQTIVVSVQNNI
jgi:hypothetical protein